MIETESKRRNEVAALVAYHAAEGIVRPPDLLLLDERYIKGLIDETEYANLQKVAAHERWNQTMMTNMKRMHFDEAYRLEIAKNLS